MFLTNFSKPVLQGNVRRAVWRISLELLRVKGKRTRVLGVRNNAVDIILVGETTKELDATLYESIFGDICHQFIIMNYVRKLKHNDSFTNERFNTVPRCQIAEKRTHFMK